MPYQIKDWSLFETSKTMSVNVKTYATFPIKTGVGFRRLMARKDGLEVYGAFMLMVIHCHQQAQGKRQGFITEDGLPDSAPLDGLDLHYKYGGGEPKAWDNAFTVLSDPDLKINWLILHGDAPVIAVSKPKKRVTAKAVTDDAESIYQAYPRKSGKAKALQAIQQCLNDGVSFDHLMDRTVAYATATARWPKHERKFIKTPAPWFNGQHYDDDPETWERVADTQKSFKDEGFNSVSDRNSTLTAWAERYSKACSKDDWQRLLTKAEERFGSQFAADMVARARSKQ